MKSFWLMGILLCGSIAGARAGAPRGFLQNLGTGRTNLAPGDFRLPAGLAVDVAGRVYATDRATGSVQMYDPMSFTWLQWRQFGTDPWGVAADPLRPIIYVADYGNHCIQRIHLSKGFLTPLGRPGADFGEFRNPAGLVCDAAGNLYVADQNNHRIQKFNQADGVWTGWGGFGQSPGQFNFPVGVDVDAAGNIYVVEYGNERVQQFVAAAGVWNVWGVAGQFKTPTGIAVDSNGAVFVADYGHDAVQWRDPVSGAWERLGTSGAEAGPFRLPTDVAAGPGGALYIADAGSKQIQEWLPAGQVGRLRVVPTPVELIDLAPSWRLDGDRGRPCGTNWIAVRAGRRRITFSEIAGWDPLPARDVEIAAGVEVTITGAYSRAFMPGRKPPPLPLP